MMVTLSRILRYGWHNFRRNGLLSLSSISIMILAAVVFEGLILFNVVGTKAIASLQEKIDISVYFKSNAPEDSILSLKASLESLDEVKGVAYVSRETALADFKIRHASESTITQTLEELGANPLLASLNIKAEDPSQYESIAKYLDAEGLKDLIEKVTFAQNQDVIKRLTSFVEALRRGGLLLTLFLAFLAVMVTFNTIRLAIFANSEQINIMRLVGASNSFIRGPYVVEGIMSGIIAAVASYLLLIPVINFVSPYIANFIPGINLHTYFVGQTVQLFLYQLLFCIGLGILSGVIAVRRHLHV